jgi:NAD(P)-dependent dehydrogenase (short-subunit alcohol dehydrogenase family)
MGWLDGQVTLITGGGSGIGRALVRRFLDEGAHVAVLERNRDYAAELIDEFGSEVVVVQGDVTNWRDNEKAVAETVAAHGKLDCFIGNAGIWDYNKPLIAFEPGGVDAIFDEIFAVNVKGNILGARAAAPELLKSRGNMIFTVSSSGSYAGGGGVIYTATKHALVGAIRQLAFELAPTVRVNGVSPGGTLTNLSGSLAEGQGDYSLRRMPGVEQGLAASNPLGIAARPEDHTGQYVLLASPANARMTTAAILHSDGGLEIRGTSPPESSKV